jgi:hypothetical protein
VLSRGLRIVSFLTGLCLILFVHNDPPFTHPLLAQTDQMQRVIELTNEIRMANGLSPLKRNDNLQQAAIYIVEDNANRNTLSHIDSLGRSIRQRFPDFGYFYSVAAENLAAGYNSPEEVINGWMSSSGHRENILRTGLCEIGAGYTYRSGTTYGHFWSQTFGCRWNTYPVVINGEAAVTTSSTVNLYIYGAGWAEQMRLSNDGSTWTEWRPYATEYTWTLAAGDGVRTVFVEIRRGTTVYQASDTIVVQNNTPPPSPSNLRQTGSTATSITLAWQDNASTESGFYLYRWNGSTWKRIATLGANVTTYTDTGLSCGQSYRYRVSTYNTAGESGVTELIDARTNPCSSSLNRVYIPLVIR